MSNSFTERELSEIHARYVKQLEADLAAARAALEAVEWVVDIGGNDVCPWCENDKPTHASDCPRQAALGTKRDIENE